MQSVRGGPTVPSPPGHQPQEGQAQSWAHADPPSEPQVLAHPRRSSVSGAQLGPGGPPVSYDSYDRVTIITIESEKIFLSKYFVVLWHMLDITWTTFM